MSAIANLDSIDRALITTGLSAGRITKIPLPSQQESDIAVFKDNCCAEQVMLCDRYTNKRPVTAQSANDEPGDGGKAIINYLHGPVQIRVPNVAGYHPKSDQESPRC